MGQREANFPEKKVKVLVAQSCLTLWDPMECSLPNSSVHGILLAKNWSGLPFPSPGIFLTQGSNPGSPSLPSAPPGKPFFFFFSPRNRGQIKSIQQLRQWVPPSFSTSCSSQGTFSAAASSCPSIRAPSAAGSSLSGKSQRAQHPLRQGSCPYQSWGCGRGKPPTCWPDQISHGAAL